MNEKILMISILTVFTLVAISFASAVTTNTQNSRKESPLYKIRTKLAIGERLQNLKSRFIGDRLFFLPFQFCNPESFSARQNLLMKSWNPYTVNVECCANTFFSAGSGCPTCSSCETYAKPCNII